MLANRTLLKFLGRISVIVYERLDPLCILCVLSDDIQDLNLVISSLQIVFGTLLDLKCNEGVIG